MEEEEKTVPYDRFQKVVSERSKLRAELDEARASLQGHAETSAAMDTMRTELEAARARLAALSVDAGIETALAERGFDADGRAIARMLHGRLPEEGRPGLAEWVDGMKADPASRPRPLLAYFDTPTAPLPPPPVPPPALPRPGAHSDGEAPAADVSADAIRIARERFERTGDAAELRAMLARRDSSRA